MADQTSKPLRAQAGHTEIDAFVQKLASVPTVRPAGQRGRLMFAMDATASREPLWQQACEIQSQMFSATAGLGGLEVQLCFYRGAAEFMTTPPLTRSEDLLRCMRKVHCESGYTQIERVLRHAGDEARRQPLNALVFVGDCMEENPERLAGRAGELALLNVPVFLFQEGMDPSAERCFRQIARLTQGAYCRFDASSAQQLRDLLSAVAVYAAGGRRALEDYGARHGGVAALLPKQVRK
jgi:hypothetical protein